MDKPMVKTPQAGGPVIDQASQTTRSSTRQQQQAVTQEVVVETPQAGGGVNNQKNVFAKISVEGAATKILAPQEETKEVPTKVKPKEVLVKIPQAGTASRGRQKR